MVRVLAASEKGTKRAVLIHFAAERPWHCRPHELHFVFCPQVPAEVQRSWSGPRAQRAPRIHKQMKRGASWYVRLSQAFLARPSLCSLIL